MNAFDIKKRFIVIFHFAIAAQIVNFILLRQKKSFFPGGKKDHYLMSCNNLSHLLSRGKKRTKDKRFFKQNLTLNYSRDAIKITAKTGERQKVLST